MNKQTILARDFAEKAHGDQKYGDGPYMEHLLQVANEVRKLDDELLNPEFLVQCAYLHDVLEDTNVESETIDYMFGPQVTEVLWHVTDPEGKNRKERKLRLHKRLTLLDSSRDICERAALIVKTADRLCNVRAAARNNPGLLEMYRKEHNDFYAAVHRFGLCWDWWEEMESLIYA